MGLWHTRRRKRREEPWNMLVAHHIPESEEAESFRILRTNLFFRGVGVPLRSAAIVSSLPDEGKSFVAANLAIVVAQSGKRVLLVDADLRKPSLHRYFRSRQSPGLSSLLAGMVSLPDAVVPTPVPNLFLLPSGPLPPTPAELLASESMDGVCAEVSSLFDFVLFDTPPLLLMADGVIVSSRTDGAVLVVRGKHTRKEDAKKSVKILTNSNVKILGAVFNGSVKEKNYYNDVKYYYNY
ncbi:CpsD/CapB family tyrosine-protein kinase [Brockia lithotrophica]|uniref:non-specific protein-tyrosine kinase n=1 Tax=Brockia lithotrophica TaxID=933949 RepID=A0A660KW01_9BACL|nr:CpsD/CapB family tyrosine-protein kinase [Brockia lithotrophica]RKQ85531.1 protein-tyrosine kinase [Brockia lithotrophica]